ncbi:MAG: hypothetical protein K0S68_559 [Candidatus Saccharibacteria bacterium]|jgi:hypothetical protein|nr:hypothetical protein [Candidatus Saccharibacteria bacterium]
MNVAKTTVLRHSSRISVLPLLHEYANVSQRVSQSMSHILTNAMEYETNNVPMETQDKKQRLLKAKIAVALRDEFGRVPTEEDRSRIPPHPSNVEGRSRSAL